MILSRSATYGLRAVLYLSLYSEKEERFGVKAIAQELDLPKSYLGKVLQNLVRKGIISSAKGPRGGFYIEDESIKRPVIDIVEAIDGLERFSACGLGLHECSDENPCSIHKEYGALRDGLFNLFSNKTVEDFKNDIQEGRAVIAL
jgi:Rrf2 family protein